MIEDLNEFLRAEPFISFRIVLASAGAYEVMSPYQVTTEGSRLRYFYRAEGFAILRLNQVVAIEVIGEPFKPAEG